MITMMSTWGRHARIIGALMMRETVTRYGRQGLGLAWLVGEPLIFCFGVLIMWTAIKPPYEHGIRIGPFIMSGYVCLLLLRHLITANMNALQANIGLLYHRQIKPLHIYISRCVLEFASNTLAFIVVYAVLVTLNQVGMPGDPLSLYAGWLLLGWMGSGLALVFAGLALQFELFERISGVLQYAMIPASGVFVMAAWLPENYRNVLMKIPMPHAVEMVRGGVFGDTVQTFHDPAYAMAWSAIFTFTGLILIARAKRHVEVE